jgi:tRNA(fMet)-specific endonuclease VapC
MRFLLDTNAWISVLNQPAGPVAVRLARHAPADVCLCPVVLGELLAGAYKSSRQAANLALLNLLCQQFVSLPFDDAAADHYGRIRAHLEAAGTPIGPYDTQIAAIAVVRGLSVVTNNTREFNRVPGLTLEDWTVP